MANQHRRQPRISASWARVLARGTSGTGYMHPTKSTAPPATAPVELPVLTYSLNSQLALHMNGEDVQLIPIPNAHADGDTMVRFVQNNVIHDRGFLPLESNIRISTVPMVVA